MDVQFESSGTQTVDSEHWANLRVGRSRRADLAFRLHFPSAKVAPEPAPERLQRRNAFALNRMSTGAGRAAERRGQDQGREITQALMPPTPMESLPTTLLGNGTAWL